MKKQNEEYIQIVLQTTNKQKKLYIQSLVKTLQ